MLYCKKEDLFEACKKSAVISWSTDNGRSSDSQEIEKNIARDIERSIDDINLYIGKKYTLPLEYIPLSLRDISVKLRLYQLLSRKGLNSELADNTIKSNRDTALKQLEMITSGKLDLGIIVNDNNDPIKDNSSSVLYKYPRNKMFLMPNRPWIK